MAAVMAEIPMHIATSKLDVFFMFLIFIGSFFMVSGSLVAPAFFINVHECIHHQYLS